MNPFYQSIIFILIVSTALQGCTRRHRMSFIKIPEFEKKMDASLREIDNDPILRKKIYRMDMKVGNIVVMQVTETKNLASVEFRKKPGYGLIVTPNEKAVKNPLFLQQIVTNKEIYQAYTSDKERPCNVYEVYIGENIDELIDIINLITYKAYKLGAKKIRVHERRYDDKHHKKS